MSELKCPFCKEELSYAQEIDGGFEILTCDCPHGIWLFGNDKMWYNLEKVITKLERTRKALDVAVDALTSCQNNTPDNYTATQAVFLLAKNSVFIDKALEQITALKQKD